MTMQENLHKKLKSLKFESYTLKKKSKTLDVEILEVQLLILKDELKGKNIPCTGNPAYTRLHNARSYQKRIIAGEEENSFDIVAVGESIFKKTFNKIKGIFF